MLSSGLDALRQKALSPAGQHLLNTMYVLLDTPLDRLPYTNGMEAIAAAMRHAFNDAGYTSIVVWEIMLYMRKQRKLEALNKSNSRRGKDFRGSKERR
jgi:hypothetical protein